MLCISFKGELTLRDVSVYSSAKGPQGLQCGEHPWAAEAKQRPPDADADADADDETIPRITAVDHATPL